MTAFWDRLNLRDRALLTAWPILCVAIAAAWHGWHSWHFFAVAGSDLLESGPHDGLHIYAAHPELQFGPITVGVAAVLSLFPAAQFVAAVVMVLLGIVSLACLIDVGEGTLGRRAIMLVVAVLAPLWAIVAVQYAHLDDTLAITFVALAMTRYRREQCWWTTVLLALAVGAKPWALPMVVLLVGAPRRLWPALAALGAALVALPWAPFFLADHATSRITSFQIPVDVGSGLHALGVHASGTPAWDRPVQFVAAGLLGILAVRRGRWVAVPFVALAVRMSIDPGAYDYYAASLAVAAGFVDAGRGRRVPAYTLGVGAWVLFDFALQAAGLNLVRSGVRLVVPLIGALLAVYGSTRSVATEPKQTSHQPITNC
ncbi:hypothetical protein [Calidifontibacter terrae]